jgi:hypothetical protein
MASRVVKFRTDTKSVAAWEQAARARQQTLSQFARDALDAATIELATGQDLDRRLIALRDLVHTALSVRTDEQRVQRIERVLAGIQAMLARETMPDA